MTTLPNTACVELHLENEWLTIWFNQPEKRNPLTKEARDELEAVFASIKNDRAIRGVTLRGRGGVFCAGGDLKAFKSHFLGAANKDDIIAMSRSAAILMEAVNTAPQIVIVLIEGAALAGGFGLACCADIVISTADAKFAMTETTIGLSPAQIAPYVIHRLGAAKARRLMLTAERFDGRAALELGFADIVADSASEIEQIEAQLKSQIMRCAPGAVAATKELILNLPRLSRKDAIEAAAHNFAERMTSQEAKEGIASFLEKRKPKWAQGEADE